MTSEAVGELCDFISGLWKGEKPPFVRVNVYRNTNFNKDGTLDDGDVAELDVEARQYAKRKLQYGDIILEKSGGGPKQPVGRVALFDKESGEYSLSNFTSAMRIRDPMRLSFAYLHRFLFWQHLAGVTETMQKRSTGIRNLNGDEYKAIRVPLPPLPEQQRIVGILDEAFAGIATAKANAEKNLRNARELFESHLEDIFARREDGWNERKLEDVVHAKCTLSYGIVQPGIEREDGLPIVRPTDLGPKVIGLAGLKRIDSALADGYKRTKLVGDELLLCVRGSTGIVGVASKELEGGNVTRGIVPIRFEPSAIQQEFGYYLFRSGATQKQIKAGTYGAALMQINIRDLRNLLVRFPSLGEQKTLVGKFDELAGNTQRLESLYQQKLAALDALKKSLLHQAFSGKLATMEAGMNREPVEA